MLYLKALLLGIVEGLTEFLPISSTGHLIIVEEYLRLTADDAFNKAFMVIIQLPAILAVVAYFWKDIWPFAHDPAERRRIVSLWTLIVAAFVPAAILGFLFDDFIEARLFHPVTVALALIAGGILLIVIERGRMSGKVDDAHDLGLGRALGIGLFQCIAMLPGTSRSAATIIGAMMLGGTRKTAAEFSFFLAIPTMLGATTLKIAKNGMAFTGEEWAVLAVGSVVSFLVAYASVAFLMNYIRNHDFRAFGYYRIVLGIAVLLLMGLSKRL